MFVAETLAGLLKRRATEEPQRVAYRFCVDPESAVEEITYARLHADATRIARTLISEGASGGRVLLFDASGLEFVRAFFGILYAGAVAVPLAPPHPTRSGGKLEQILADAKPRACIVSSALAQRLARLQAALPALAAVRLLECDELTGGFDDAGGEPPGCADLVAEQPAVLQYTSGSTSAPKGVVVSHRNFLENAVRVGARMGADATTVAVSWLPLYHDMGLMNGVILPLVGGYPVVMMPPARFSAQPLDWLRTISRFRATMTGAPNFAYQACADRAEQAALAGLDLSSVKLAFCGAEPIQPDSLRAFVRAYEHVGFRRDALFPCYGLAEATLFVAGGPAGAGLDIVRAARASFERCGVAATPAQDEDSIEFVSCGLPAWGQRLAIVDPATLAELGERRVGEIWVQGPSVAQGYLNRLPESEATFGVRIAGDADGQFLRTGDLGFLAEGRLVVTGRLKDLIIVRGENHYPQDIELSVERCHPALQKHAGAACARHPARGDEGLLIVQEVKRTWRRETDEIIRAIRAAVTEAHGIAPASIVLVRQGVMPVTTSGKIQRAAARTAFYEGSLDVLAQWHADDQRRETSAVTDAADPAAHGGVRAALAGAWREVLRTTDIDARSHFFELGGDSLAVVALSARIRALWGIEVDIDQLFRTPTFEAFAVHVADIVANGGGERVVTAVSGSREGRMSSPVSEAPLSPIQASVWLDQQRSEENGAYHIAVQLMLSGRLDVRALSRALSSVVQRHGMLRARFSVRGDAVMQRVVEPPAIALDVRDGDGDLAAHIHAFAVERFDLTTGAPCRFRLWRIAPTEHRLAIVVHHLVADGWSMRRIVQEAIDGYAAFIRGAEPPFSASAPQYLDWVAGECGDDRRLADPLAYWRRQLSGAPDRLALPVDHAHGAPRSSRGGAVEVRLRGPRLEALRALARAEGVTLFMLLLAAFQLQLSRWSGEEDVLVGSPFANRSTLDTEQIVGLFANIVVLRGDLSGDPTFRAWLARVREVVLAAQRAASAPFSHVATELRKGRGGPGQSLVQAEFVLQPGVAPSAPIDGLSVSAALIDTHACKFDLALALFEQPDELSGTLGFSLDLFEPETMKEFVGQWQRLIDAILAAPLAPLSSLSPLTAEASDALLRRWSAPSIEAVPDTSLYALFDAQARRSPQSVALVQGTLRLTYGELASGARRVAQTLMRLGVAPETPVGLCVERSSHMIVALLGILAAGGAYVPLDAELPRRRLDFMFADANVQCVIVDAGSAPLMHDSAVQLIDVADALASGIDEHARALPRLHGGNLAYVVYTSGSTGTPKGVAGHHAGAVNYLTAMARQYALSAEDTVLNMSALSFDASLRDIFGPLSVGAKLVLVPSAEARNPASYRAELTRHAVTRLLSGTPSFVRAICGASLAPVPSLKTVLLSGEVLDRQLCAHIRDRLGAQVGIFNQYGPTECTMTTTWTDASRAIGERIPIGRPIANAYALVLDAAMHPVAPLVCGELYIGGPGLTRGYVGRPDLTAERFVPDPFAAGARLYRTGDRVRWRVDGQLEFLGRTDHQLKIRGARVETGEIEAVLSRHPHIRQVAVVPKSSAQHELTLIAYVTSRREALDAAALRRHLQLSLPDYAVPSGFVQLEDLPLTITGKIDRRALALLDAPLLQTSWIGPSTDVEKQLADLLSEMLDVAPIGMTDNFFTLGGHSLMAMRVLARVRERFGVDMTIRDFFESETLAQVAAGIEALRQEELSS